ncbi:anaphase-promoting complex subunit 1-like isoform X2 [Bolinopsis microptera]|uniref:anaphase-promoting complex subunit 1-like isoform X2 n=1 Tax=Bolinopsis microptera TaxID=2820187 RepID=UPI00307961B3
MESEAEAVIVQGKSLHLFGKDFLSYHPLIADFSQALPQWNICNRHGIEYELYWQGCILACSRGTVKQKMLLKCLTVDQPINQAMLASMSNERDESEDYIVVVTDVNVHFFSFHGQDISRALPFHGAHVWSLNPGLLIHKKPCKRGDSTHSSTVSLLDPLDEYSYIQMDSSSSRDSFGRESVLDNSYNILSVLASDETKLIVTSQNSSLIIWKLNKIEKSPVTMHSSNFTPIDDIEGLKSKIGVAIFTPNSARSNTSRIISNSQVKQQVHRERTPSTNASSFLHTLPNVTSGDGHSAVNHTLLSTTRYSTICSGTGLYITKVYSDSNIGSYKNIKVSKYSSHFGDKFLAILDPSTCSLQCLKLKDNGGLCPPVFIPCSDFGHMPQSQFLVVIHPAGLVYLYDGVCQMVRLILHDKEIISKPANKKPRKSSEDILAAQISFSLPEAFVLREQDGLNHYCEIPTVARDPVIKNVVAGMNALHPNSECFYRILVRLFLSNTDMDSWEVLKAALLEFVGVRGGHDHSSVTLHDPTIRRTRHSQTNEDWEYMLNVMLNEVNGGAFGLPLLDNMTVKELQPSQMTASKELCESTLQVLHLVHCELQLDVHNRVVCQKLADVIHHISCAGGFEEYVNFYRSSHPHLGALLPHSLSPSLVSLNNTLISLLSGNKPDMPPLVPGITDLTESVLILYLLITEQPLSQQSLRYLRSGSKRVEMVNVALAEKKYSSLADRVLVAMVTLGLDQRTVNSLPVGIQLPLLDVLYPAHCNPPSGLPPPAYTLVHRTDVISSAPSHFMQCNSTKKEQDMESDMAFESPVLDFRFPEDKRVEEAAHMFATSQPVKIVVSRRPEMTDAEYVDQQELLLFNKTKRTMAIPVGRSLFTFSTFRPSPRDPIVIPDVCISGKALPRGNTVKLDLDIPAEMIHWSEFHSGVATGLRIDPLLSDIDSQWIVYNRPQDLTNKHAGFLFALGLTGHLKKLSSRNLHDYLCQRHKFTSIGLLLGLGVTNKGTQDETTTKLFSIHIPALLPPTAVPLELDHLVQTAAIAGLGLVYIGSAHRRMAEILLDEIGRAPGPEMDNSEDREGYSLACGFSLGLVLLGMGNENLPGLDDLKLSDRLYKYINGGKKEESSSVVPPSFRIWEGNMINTSVSSIGATVALGLTFLKTGNQNIARTLAAPHTEFLLEGVRPDMLLLRSVCYGLIMWDEILPTTDWINSQVPEVLLDCLEVLTGVSEDSSGISLKVDPETAFPCTLTILAGGCFALALRFAGTANKAAFKTIMFYLYTTHHISRHPRDFAGFSKDLTEMCLVCLLVSASIVMAGTGNLELMRLIRKLRKRIVPVNTYGHNFVTYGCHMGIHMSLGLLFLGGGRYTLKRDNESVAALFLSLYPIFQTCQDDNTYHLQAFRHLWVIAAQPRLLITVDEHTNTPCYVPVTITTSPDCVPRDITDLSRDARKCSPDLMDQYNDISRSVFTPVMLPEFDTIKSLSVIGERYWPITVSDVETLKKGFLYVKKRAGFLEYKDDPEGKINTLGRGDRFTTPIIDTIKTFSKDESILLFAEKFCAAQSSSSGVEFCTEQLLSCLLEERAQYLPFYTTLHKTFTSFVDSPDPVQAENIRLIVTFYEGKRSTHLFSSKLLSKLSYRLEELYKDAAVAEPKAELPLSDIAKKTINSHRWVIETDNDSSDTNVLSDVAETLSAKQPREVVAKFMELLTISGV